MAGDAPDAAAASRYARRRLETELPAWLRYHDAEHTIGLVVPAAELLADDLALAAGDRAVLVTAAWFHDLGFIERYEENEGIAVGYAEAVLPGFGFGADDVAAVTAAIWATKVPQRPSTAIAEVMCDADLFVLGTDRFADREQALRDELATAGMVHTDESWDRSQVSFLETHRWFTDAAARRGAATKAANLAEVRQRLERSSRAS